MRKVAILFFGALLLFMGLAHLDQYENLISPLTTPSKSPFARPSDRVNNDVLKVIREFNDSSADAYLASDPSLLATGLTDRSLLSSIADEISYLTREGKVMEIKVKDIKIEKVEFLSSNLIRATTGETVELRYLDLSKGNEDAAYPEAQYNMAYTLMMSGNRWRIINYETRSVKELK